MCSGSRCIPAPRHPFASRVTGSGTEVSCLSHRITRSLTWADGALTARSKEAKKNRREKRKSDTSVTHSPSGRGAWTASSLRHQYRDIGFFLLAASRSMFAKKILYLSSPPLLCSDNKQHIPLQCAHHLYLCTLICMHAINSPWRARLGKGKNENSSSCVVCCLCNCGHMYCGRGGRGSPTN